MYRSSFVASLGSKAYLLGKYIPRFTDFKQRVYD